MIPKNVGFFLTNTKLRQSFATNSFQSFSICSKLRNVAATSSVMEKIVQNNQKHVNWSLFGSVCIERMPIITCDMNDLENRYSNLINELNVRKSLLSDHELRHLKDL